MLSIFLGNEDYFTILHTNFQPTLPIVPAHHCISSVSNYQYIHTKHSFTNLTYTEVKFDRKSQMSGLM